MDLLTELKLLFRARVFLVVLMAELYIIVLALTLDEFDESRYLRSIYLFGNIVPWAVAGLVLAVEMVTRDIQCGTFWILNRLSDPLMLYLKRIVLIFGFILCMSSITDAILTWAVLPFSVLSVALSLLLPLALFLSAGFLAAIRFRSETPAMLASAVLLVPLLPFVSGIGPTESPLARALSAGAMAIAAGTMLWVARIRMLRVASEGAANS